MCLWLGLLAGCNPPDRAATPLPTPVDPAWLGRKAQFHADSARSDSAIAYYQRAAMLYRKRKNQAQYLASLNQAGLHQYRLGRLSPAERTLRNTLSLGIYTLGERSEPVAQAYAYLGQVLQQTGRTAEADSLVRQSYHIRKILFGENHPATAESLGLLAVTGLNDPQQNYEKALQTGLRALQVHQVVFGPKSYQTAVTHLALGTVYNRRAEYRLALQSLARADTLLEVLVPRHHFDRSRLHLEKGVAYLRLGNTGAAGRDLEKAVAGFRATSGPGSLFTALAYGQLGSLRCDEGNYEAGIRLFQQELAGMRKSLGDNHASLAGVYTKMGFAYGQMGDTEKYLQSCRNAFAISTHRLDSNHVNVAHAYFMLASACVRNGLYEEGIYNFQRAKAIFSQNLGGYHPMVANCYQGLGRTYKRLKSYPEALVNYQTSLAITSHNFGPGYPETAFIYKMLGDIHQEQHQPDSALAYYQRAIAALAPGYNARDVQRNPPISSVQQRRVLYYNLLDVKAGHFRRKYARGGTLGDLDFALRNLEEAAALIDTIRVGFKGEEARTLLSEHTRFVYQHGLEVAHQLYERTARPAYLEKAFYFSEKGKASVLLDVARKVSAERTAGIPQDLLTREEELKHAIAGYEQKLQEAALRPATADSAKVQEWTVASAEAKDAYQQFMDTLERSYPQYYRLKYDPRVATLAAVQGQLSAGQGLISYSLTDSAGFVFIVTPQRQFLHRLPYAPAADSLVLRFREALLSRDPGQYTRQAYGLYERLVAPIRPALAGITELTVVPEGTISYVPFETLLTRAPGTKADGYAALPYLLNDFTLRYDFSGTFFVQHAQRDVERRPKSLMAYAPSFRSGAADTLGANADRERDNLWPLPGARREAERIAGITGGAFAAGLQATETAFKTTATRHGVLHLATHGLLDDRNPAYSKLVFAPAAGEGEDGYLYAYELYNLRLDAELVVLSACNTGVGTLQKGEGVKSLARGFAYAGCANVLMSLWPSSDQATARIMEYFYEALAAGRGKDAALREAKLKYLQRADPLTANPYFWGTFVLIGDSRPVGFPLPLWQKLLAGAALLLVTAAIAWQVYRLRRKRRNPYQAASKARAFSP
ncbi:MAG TPA: CHAT domain-containing tetratricopeptide repeat protein [Cytophagales bacterium]